MEVGDKGLGASVEELRVRCERFRVNWGWRSLRVED
jgi:hypothetical protein